MFKFNIDGVDYQVESLSETGKAQLRSLQFVESQLQQLHDEAAVFQTARQAYLAALKLEIMGSGVSADTPQELILGR